MKKRLVPAALLAVIACCTASGQTYTISTFAGGGIPTNIPGKSAYLANPVSIALDAKGTAYFVTANIVLRLDATTGLMTLVAGNGVAGFSGDNGLATSAQLNQPHGLAVDSAGNLYIADSGNGRVRKVSNGVITTVAGGGTGPGIGDGGPATSAPKMGVEGVAVDSSGNLYIADAGDNRIRKVSNGVITTVAGSGPTGPSAGSSGGFSGDGGPATSAQLFDPSDVAVDSAGNLYIADTYNDRIRMVSNGVITTIAGTGVPGFSGDGGPASSAQIGYFPQDVAVDSAGNVYIPDNGRIRMISNGVINTIAGGGTGPGIGDNGPATSAELEPDGVAVDSAGNLIIADGNKDRIRKVSNGVITTVAGGGPESPGFGDNGPATSAQLGDLLHGAPDYVAIDSAANLYLNDTNRVRKVSNGVITTIAGTGVPGFSGDGGPAIGAQLSASGLAVDPAGNVYIADAANYRIRKVSNGVITTVAGNGTQGFSGDNGPAISAQLNPSAIAVDSAGNLYIADDLGNEIRKVANGVITSVAGFLNPGGIAVDSAGHLYVAASLAGPGGSVPVGIIYKVSGGVITTVAGGNKNPGTGDLGDGGPATSAVVYPGAVAVDAAGNLYIVDAGNGIRKISNGVINTIAGGGSSVLGDNGPATSVLLNSAAGIAVDSAGNVYFGDPFNNRVRLLTPGTAPVITPGGVVPVYSSVPVIQPGSWVSIYGTNLANGTFFWSGNFPTSLGSTSVTIDNKPAYLWFVSPTQINLQAPDDTATGLVSIAVTTASGTKASTVTLAPQGPSFLLLGDNKHVVGEIATPNGTGAYANGTYDLVGPSDTFSYSTRPVNPGETLVLYGVGFGPTTPHVPAGQNPTVVALTNSPITVTIGGVRANFAFAGINTEAGLYQINVVVPNTPSGDQALQATVNGVLTPAGPVVTVQ
jgi:uncharacterized protein (TIGR03437 family)